MSNAMTAAQLLADLLSLPETERSRFFLLLQLLGCNQMYATGDLKVLKRTRHPQRPATA